MHLCLPYLLCLHAGKEWKSGIYVDGSKLNHRMPEDETTGESGEEREEEEVLFGYEEELKEAQSAVNEYLWGKHKNIAIVSDPFAGRSTLVEYLARDYLTTTIAFNSVMTEKAFISTLHDANNIIIMDNCHFLAMRKIGGFAQLDEFLRFLSKSDKLFITTWNTYSWSYLSAVKNLDEFFPKVIRLHPMNAESLKKMIISHYGDNIKYIDDAASKDRRLSISWKCVHITIPFSSTTRCLPWPYLNLSSIFHKKKRENAEQLVFDRLKRVSGGNPGIARKIWDASIDYPKIGLSSIKEPTFDTDLSINEAFLLGIILTMEKIELGDLAEIAGPEIDVEESLYILMNRELVAREEGYYIINYRALKSVKSYLELNRMVW